MVVNKFFLKHPTSITTTKLNIPLKYKNEVIDELYTIGDRQNKQTNVKAIMSSYFIWDETKVLNPLINKIFNTIGRVVPPADPNLIYRLENCWSAIYKKGHYTIPHNHEAGYGSFIYYLKSNPNSSPLIFDDCDFTISPTDDLLVIFPGHLNHSVPPHTDNEDRIGIAGNFNLIQKPRRS